MNKRQWNIRRTTIEAPEAQRRWDQAYQLLLQGSASSSPLSTQESRPQEDDYEHRSLRSRFDTTTSTDTDHRTTTRQFAELL